MGREIDKYEPAAKKSAERFNRLIKDDLLQYLGSEYIAVEECQEQELNRIIDMYGGIDLILKKGISLRGVASRIQKHEKNWRTFTIRHERDTQTGLNTEYKKRLYAIENEWLYPHYTLQAYLDANEALLGYAICRTKDLFDLIKRGLYRENHTKPDQKGQATFLIVDWDDFKKHGFDIYEVNNELPF